MAFGDGFRATPVSHPSAGREGGNFGCLHPVCLQWVQLAQCKATDLLGQGVEGTGRNSAGSKETSFKWSSKMKLLFNPFNHLSWPSLHISAQARGRDSQECFFKCLRGGIRNIFFVHVQGKKLGVLLPRLLLIFIFYLAMAFFPYFEVFLIGSGDFLED